MTIDPSHHSQNHRTVNLANLNPANVSWSAIGGAGSAPASGALRDTAAADKQTAGPIKHRLNLPQSLMRQMALVEGRQGNFAKAIALLNRLIDCCPHSAEDYNNRGVVYWRMGKLGQAIADFNQALLINPALHNAYNNRGNIQATRGNRAGAIADYERCLDLNPFNVRARINLGVTYRETRRYGAALNCFDDALLFGQLEGQILAERVRTYHLRGDWNCAIANYSAALTKLSQISPRQLDGRRMAQKVRGWLGQLMTAETA